MRDLGSTILCCTPSYAAYIGETLHEMGFTPDDIKLKAGYQSSAAGALFSCQHADIPRSVTEQRESFLGDAGENKLSLFWT